MKEVPAEEKNNKSATGSPHFYRKGTTPTQSPSGSPCPSPSASPTTVKNTFNKIPATENRTPTAESQTAGKDPKSLLEGLVPFSRCLVTPSLPGLKICCFVFEHLRIKDKNEHSNEFRGHL